MVLYFFSLNCTCQITKEIKINEIQIDTMKILDLSIYKDWKVNPDFASSQTSENINLVKGNDRVNIIINDKILQVERSNINNPYRHIWLYDPKSKILQITGVTYKILPIGIFSFYNDKGIKFKEIDYEQSYKFSITDMIKKFKIEYNLDIENPKVLYDINRFIGKTELKIPLYEVSIREDFPYVCTSYLIDGNTGKTLYSIKMDEIEPKSVLHEYFKILKKQKEEDNAYFNTYKGKDYTKAEWEIFKEQHYKEYERKKESKGFWHDLFKKHDE